MVKNTKNNREIKRFRDSNERPAISSVSPSTSNSILTQNNFDDDLIVSLTDAYENRRARQVFEWEKEQKRTIISAV